MDTAPRLLTICIAARPTLLDAAVMRAASLALDPLDPYAQQTLGRMLLAGGQSEEAL